MSAMTIARVAEPSPLFKARLAGFFWLMTAVTGSLAMAAYQKVVVANDAVATAANYLAHEQTFRLGVASDILATACYLTATLLVYALLAPVNRTASLLAAFFSVAGCAISALSFVFRLAPLALLKDGPEQLRALAHTFVGLNTLAAAIGFIFFGLHCLMVGSLILRSAFLPRFIGVLMVLAAVGWSTFGFTNVIAPAVAPRLVPYIFMPGGIGEITLSLWLLIKGVDVRRWNEQAAS